MVYCTLPLYHTAGGLLGVSLCLIHGATLVIRRKFSASRFFDECIEYKVTVSIMHTCTYILDFIRATLFQSFLQHFLLVFWTRCVSFNFCDESLTRSQWISRSLAFYQRSRKAFCLLLFDWCMQISNLIQRTVYSIEKQCRQQILMHQSRSTKHFYGRFKMLLILPLRLQQIFFVAWSRSPLYASQQRKCVHAEW